MTSFGAICWSEIEWICEMPHHTASVDRQTDRIWRQRLEICSVAVWASTIYHHMFGNCWIDAVLSGPDLKRMGIADCRVDDKFKATVRGSKFPWVRYRPNRLLYCFSSNCIGGFKTDKAVDAIESPPPLLYIYIYIIDLLLYWLYIDLYILRLNDFRVKRILFKKKFHFSSFQNLHRRQKTLIKAWMQFKKGLCS